MPPQGGVLEPQRLGLHDALDGGDLGREVDRQRLVDLDQRDCRAARLVAAEMEGGDIDLVLAQQGAETADEARLVVVGDVEHVRAELGLDLDALDLDDARALAANKVPVTERVYFSVVTEILIIEL